MAKNDASGNYDPDEPGSAPHQAPEDEVEYVEVYFEPDEISDVSKALTDAAGDRQQDVVLSGDYFRVPKALAEKAKLGGKNRTTPQENTEPRQTAAKTIQPNENEPGSTQRQQTRPAAKKTAAKKAPAKKAAPRSAKK